MDEKVRSAFEDRVQTVRPSYLGQLEAEPSVTPDSVANLESNVLNIELKCSPETNSVSCRGEACQSPALLSRPPPESSPPLSSTSFPNFLRVPVWEPSHTNSNKSSLTSPIRSSSSSSSSSPDVGLSNKTKDDGVNGKSENDIKVYVESTMNELLGWYGLSKMDQADTSQLSMTDFPLPQDSPHRPDSTTSAVSPRQPTASNSNQQQATSSISSQKRRKSKVQCIMSKLANDTNNNSSSSSCVADDEDDNDHIDVGEKEASDEVNFQLSFTSSSDVSGLISPELAGGEVPDAERGMPIICSWCQHPGNKLFTLDTPAGTKSFCNELCFTQCRRASFKRNKVCEWCKHVRHTLNFVDFQDGDVQLQFCSEKCLNQYKMNIFCTEARQHLAQMVDLPCEQNLISLTTAKGSKQEKELLITPDMWLSAQTSNPVEIKQEMNEEDQAKTGEYGCDTETKSKKRADGVEPGEVQDTRSRWSQGVELARQTFSDNNNLTNEDRVGRKVKSPSVSRPQKDKSTPRSASSKSGNKSGLDSCNLHDREPVKKLSGTNVSDHRTNTLNNRTNLSDHRTNMIDLSHDNSCSSSSLKDPHSKTNQIKDNATQPHAAGPSFSSQSINTLPLLPSWSASQLFAMMPSHLNSALMAANISSSLGGPGYAPTPLLYSSLLGPASLAIAAQKELASSSLLKSKHQSRRELLRDRSLEADSGVFRRESTERIHIRGESTERSTKSTSSTYSSSDTPGPSSTPGVTQPTGQDSTFAPGFIHQIPFTTNNLNQQFSLPHYLTDPTMTGMLPMSYNLNHSHRPGVSQVPRTPQIPVPPMTTPQPLPQQLPQPLPQQTVPPVTILVPYPVAVPIPIPVPIPLPIAPEKLFAFLREKSAQTNHESQQGTSQQRPSDPRSTFTADYRSRTSSTSQSVDMSPVVSPQLSSKSLQFGCLPLPPSEAPLKSPELNQSVLQCHDPTNPILSLKRESAVIVHPSNPVSQCTTSGLKHAVTPSHHFNHGRSKKARLDCQPFSSEDEAIDLSKLSSRSSTPRISGNCSEKENPTFVKQESFSDSDVDSSSQTTSTITVPRIHIVSDHHNDANLCSSSTGASLSIAPQKSSYSERRSRILDAPSVPKKIRSPSPERRYIRTVPRDMVDAARRRGLRARVRTK